MVNKDTIVALSTAQGIGAIAVIRLSGEHAISIADRIFYGKNLDDLKSHTALFGTIRKENKIIDEVVLTLFKAPHSFTRENIVEISCHGSDYIIQQIIQLAIALGARLANAGEFTQRAYLNGQMDLAQAEAIADLIAADSEIAHKVALQQMRGGFSNQIKALRENFVRLAALLELELDFSEEDVEFADRHELEEQIKHLFQVIQDLSQSFALGNVIKNGFPVAIIGKPNAGKSTLLNTLLQEDKAIVSSIAGTTRDAIEDEKVIKGIRFRFIDTAGLRETEDEIESIGIARTRQKIEQANFLIFLFDVQSTNLQDLESDIQDLRKYDIPFCLVGNKIDTDFDKNQFEALENAVFISANSGENLDTLEKLLTDQVNLNPLQKNQTIVTNLRHYESLQSTLQALKQVQQSLTLGLSTEMVASDMRETIYHLGTITGEITNKDLLEHIFSKFCIGK